MRNLLTPLFIFTSFLIALLVSLSIPIINSISLFSLTVNADELKNSTLHKLGVNYSSEVQFTERVSFGLWGYCIPGIRHSLNGTATTLSNFCSHPKSGYTIDQQINDALGNIVSLDEYQELFTRITKALSIVQCIIVALVFICLILSLIINRQGSVTRLTSRCALVLSIIAALVTSAAFAVIIVFTTVLRNRLKGPTENIIAADWGNVVGMMLGAASAMWLGVFGICGGILCGNDRKSAQH